MTWFISPFLFSIHPLLSIIFQLLALRLSFQHDKHIYVKTFDLFLFIVLVSIFFLQSFLVYNSFWQDVRILFFTFPFFVFRLIDPFKIFQIILPVSIAAAVLSFVQFIFSDVSLVRQVSLLYWDAGQTMLSWDYPRVPSLGS